MAEAEIVEAEHADALAGELLADPARRRAVLAEGEAVGEHTPSAQLAVGKVDDTGQDGPGGAGKGDALGHAPHPVTLLAETVPPWAHTDRFRHRITIRMRGFEGGLELAGLEASLDLEPAQLARRRPRQRAGAYEHHVRGHDATFGRDALHDFGADVHLVGPPELGHDQDAGPDRALTDADGDNGALANPGAVAATPSTSAGKMLRPAIVMSSLARPHTTSPPSTK